MSFHFNTTQSSILQFLIFNVNQQKDRNDRHWHLRVLLRQILCISLQNTIDYSTPVRFAALVERHNLYLNLIGDLIPKHHFITHYADIMKNFGPVVNAWCMRFELKHLDLKKYCNVTKNHINLCYSVDLKDVKMPLCPKFNRQSRENYSNYFSPCACAKVF